MKIITAISIEEGFIGSVRWRDYELETQEWTSENEVVKVAQLVREVERNCRFGIFDVRTGGVSTRGLNLRVIEYGFGRKSVLQTKSQADDCLTPRLHDLPRMSAHELEQDNTTLHKTLNFEHPTQLNALLYVRDATGTDLLGFLDDHKPDGARLWLDLSIAGLVYLGEANRINITESGLRELSRRGI